MKAAHRERAYPRPSRPAFLRKLACHRGQSPQEPDPRPRTKADEHPAELPGASSPTAKAEWKRLAQTLNRVGLLTQADRAALAAYCQACGRWVEAERKLAETPILLKTPAGYMLPSPWLGIANKQLELMAKFMGGLGLTPSARSRVTVQNPSLTKPWEFGFDEDDLLAKPSW